MTPSIRVAFIEPRTLYWPGETLACRYQIDAANAGELQAVEASIMWQTEGKGEEDLAVHAFQRRVANDATDGDLTRPALIETVLPNSPLSYSGMILKIRWRVRIRVFYGKGREVTEDLPFKLGDVPDPIAPESSSSTTPANSSPATANPGAANPGAANPGAANPGAASPGAASPSGASPSAANPGAASPGAASPSAANSSAASSSAASSGTAANAAAMAIAPKPTRSNVRREGSSATDEAAE
jgi:hypothetical protein